MLQKGKTIFTSLFLFVLLSACNTANNLETDKQTLLKIDRKFSELSKEKGSLEAFSAYMASDGIVLPKKGHPIHKNVYDDALTRQEPGDQAHILTWEPLLADISKSADLGYTHGTYQLINLHTSGKRDTTYGYYITVWKRQLDGNWRFVFDTGNEIEDQ